MENGWEEHDPFVTVVEFTTLMELDIARALLESADIECFCPEEHLLAASGGIYSYAVHPRLQVHSSQLERAREVLNAPFEEPR